MREVFDIKEWMTEGMPAVQHNHEPFPKKGNSKTTLDGGH
jgi:hypothetical protein